MTMTNFTTDTGDTEVDVALNELANAINDKNITETKVALATLHDMALSNAALVKWIIVPANITDLHKRLIESLDVAPRMMQLRKRIPQYRKRAVFFVKAMQNGVNRLDEST